MIENTITIGTPQDFKNIVESYGVPLNKSTAAVVTPEAPKSDLSMTNSSDFFDFVRGLGLTANDVAIVSDQALMEMTQEKRVPRFKDISNKENSGLKIKMK